MNYEDKYGNHNNSFKLKLHEKIQIGRALPRIRLSPVRFYSQSHSPSDRSSSGPGGVQGPERGDSEPGGPLWEDLNSSLWKYCIIPIFISFIQFFRNLR